MKNQPPEARIAEIFDQMSRTIPFLPGSVRRSTDKRRNAKGETKIYEGQPIFNYAVGGKRKDKRIPKESFERVRQMTLNYKRFKELEAQLQQLLVDAYLPDVKKKSRRHVPC